MVKDRIEDLLDRLVTALDVADTADTVSELHTGTYERVVGILSSARTRYDYASVRSQERIAKRVDKVMQTFSARVSKRIMADMKVAANKAISDAVRHMKAAGIKPANTVKWHREKTAAMIRAAGADASKYASIQASRIVASVKSLMRDEAIAITRRARVEGVTLREAHERAKAYLLTMDPKFQFIDRTGRRWDSQVYYEMLAKTTLAKITNDAYLTALTLEGQDLVVVSSIGSKDHCKHWEGKVLSITGKTPGYKTIAEATATGEVFHPRCRHTIALFAPKIYDV